MICLNDIRECIHHSALVEGNARNFLEEQKTNTKIQLCVDGQYLLYDFEKIEQPLFPFFEKGVKGLNAIADKVIFTEDSDGNLWAFVIELKQGKADPSSQLHATKQFVKYVLESISRACKTEYKVELRGLGYSKNHRPTTKLKNPYDKFQNALFTGKKLFLSYYQI